ncbi:MAG: hypothetical protein PGN34_07820 [Methylobacterium frigidaeris]
MRLRAFGVVAAMGLAAGQAAAAPCMRPAGPGLRDAVPTQSWRSTAADVNWSPPAEVGALTIGHNPWGAADMAAGDALVTDLFVDAKDGSGRLRVRAGAPATKTGLPKGAPYMLVGMHGDHASRDNPFTTRGVPGLWTSDLGSLRAETAGTLIESGPRARYAHAFQTYLYFDRYTGKSHDGAPYLDVMVVFNRVNNPASNVVAERTIDGRPFVIERVDIGGYKDNFYTVQVAVPDRTAFAIDMLAVIETIRQLHNAHTGRADARYWMRAVGTWVEPISGRVDYVIDGLRVTVDGRDYGTVACGR